MKPLLSPADVAKQCGLSRKAVYRSIERGELAASRVCSRLRVRPEDVDVWLAENAVVAPERHAPKITRTEPLPRLPARGGLRNLLSSS